MKMAHSDTDRAASKMSQFSEKFHSTHAIILTIGGCWRGWCDRDITVSIEFWLWHQRFRMFQFMCNQHEDRIDVILMFIDFGGCFKQRHIVSILNMQVLHHVEQRWLDQPTANRWATAVETTICSAGISHLLPTRTRGRSCSNTCLSHSPIHPGRFSNDDKFVTS